VIQQYFPATVELAAFSMAVALIIELALVAFRIATRHDFRCVGKAVWNYYLCDPIFGGMLMQLFCRATLVSPRVAFSRPLPPPSGRRDLHN